MGLKFLLEWGSFSVLSELAKFRSDNLDKLTHKLISMRLLWKLHIKSMQKSIENYKTIVKDREA